MTKFAVLALLCLAVAASVTAIASASAPTRLTEIQMSQSIEDKGQMGRGRPVLDANCSGQGSPTGAFPYERFRLFDCYVTSTRHRVTEWHVTLKGNGWDADMFDSFIDN